LEHRRRQSQRREEEPLARRVNVGDTERAVSIAAGAIIGLLGLGRRSVPGLITATVGGGLIYRGVTGYCPLCDRLGIDTAHDQGQTQEQITERGIQIEQALQINRSPEELYQFWRNFQNLPRIMSYLESVRVIDERRSHWVAKAPRIAGGKVKWDAEITRDEPSSRIAWRSLPGSDIDTAGEIRFSRAMGDRGTDVHVFMSYVPPAGKLGHWIASMLGENPRRVVREDLRNFKRVMELGEILTIVGQPHGTCAGQGKRYTESDWKPLYR
jgi:uncharacterized membrane protein